MGDLIDKIVNLVTGKTQTPVNQGIQSAQTQNGQQEKQQLGWKDAPGGGGYLPVFNTDQNPSPQYKYFPATQLKTTPTSIQQAQQLNGKEIEGFNNWNPPKEYADLVKSASKNNNVPPALIASIIQNENGGWSDKVPNRPNYDSNGNIISYDRGYAQINNVAHPEVTDSQAKDPKFAINFIAHQLQGAYKKFGNWHQAIASYNVGNQVGPDPSRDENGLGPIGKNYLNNALSNVAPETLRQIGLKTQY